MGLEVNTKKLNTYADKEKSISSKLNSLNTQLNTCRKQLKNCLSSSASSGIDKEIAEIYEELGNVAVNISIMGSKLDTIAQMYEITENSISGSNLKQEKINEVSKTSAGGGNGSFGGGAGGGFREADDVDSDLKKILRIISIKEGEEFTGLVKLVSKFAKVTKKSEVLAALGPLINYSESLLEFYGGDKSGLDGASDFADLMKDSGKLFSAFYKIFDKKYDFKTNMPYMGGLENSFSLFASVGGILGGFIDVLNTEGEPAYKTISTAISASGEVFDLAEDIDTLAGVGGGEPDFNAISAKTLLKMGINITAQAVESYGKYYTDDNHYSFNDFLETVIDSGVAGLVTIPQEFTFGLIDIDEDALSEEMKSSARETAYNAAKYVTSNPKLLEMYNNSGDIGQYFLIAYGAVVTKSKYIRYMNEIKAMLNQIEGSLNL